jgi:hypothetical protein
LSYSPVFMRGGFFDVCDALRSEIPN